MKHILSLAYSLRNTNFDQIIKFEGEEVRITQFSTGHNFNLTRDLIRKYDGECDLICLSGIPHRIHLKKRDIVNPTSNKLKLSSHNSPIIDGEILEEIYIPWMLRQVYLNEPELISNKKISFYSGSQFIHCLDVLREFTADLRLADPYYFFHLPTILRNKKSLEKFLFLSSNVLKKMNFRKENIPSFSNKENILTRGLRRFFSSHVFVATSATISSIDLDHLKGKTLIIDFLNPLLEKKLISVGVKNIITCLPSLNDFHFSSFALYEGLLQLTKNNNNPLSASEILSWVGDSKLAPEIKKYDQEKSSNKKEVFAFIIHPLAAKMLFKQKGLRFMKDYSKPLERSVENIASNFPGFFYGKIKGIKSEKTGREVEGIIYAVPDTPRKLLEADTSTIYKKLVDLSYQAREDGANIIGLGAYTKIVGDAGVTVARRSPIPVTTGNSLSAASTLWAAKLAVEKIGLVKKENGKWKGKAMVVGATGSIGAVSAKVMASRWEEIILVAPRGYKLLELKDEIEKISPDSKYRIATSPEKELVGECDLIITTTSAQGRKILEINDVKPGCVICDVSRPFDIQEEDALQRPDVMVIASGEVQLPGRIDSKVDLGLEGNVVYACLAETALLALDGTLENFTLSRNINYKKVLEIDKMAAEHGVRLSAIMGHSGFVTDEEFRLCTEHAVERLKTWTTKKEEPHD
ncbi:MAG: hypothetical protein VYD54_05955 [Bdellovibrionota bacterium]|nr:hypothetical protein [Bdellovibrionota bacterium]